MVAAAPLANGKDSAVLFLQRIQWRQLVYFEKSRGNDLFHFKLYTIVSRCGILLEYYLLKGHSYRVRPEGCSEEVHCRDVYNQHLPHNSFLKYRYQGVDALKFCYSHKNLYSLDKCISTNFHILKPGRSRKHRSNLSSAVCDLSPLSESSVSYLRCFVRALPHAVLRRESLF